MKKALLIGIHYTDISGATLKGCINDIINMRNMLIDSYDFNSDDIIMLRDDDILKFQPPTYFNILDCLSSIVEESNNLEEFWLHYSGHGSRIQTNNSNSGFSEIIIPVDFKESACITDIELLNQIKKLKCRSMLLFDCCHSGTVCDLPWVFDYSIENLKKTKMNDLIIDNSNIFMFSGCKDDQTSSDTINFLDQKVGAFTNSFLECLRKSHHNIDILSLYKNICIDLLKTGYTQIPLLSSTSQDPKYNFNREP
jgi:hypothetical protein